MKLEVKPWNELSRKEINDIFSLRSEVFIVEQDCAYQDVDGKDDKADHILLSIDEELVGYARIFNENIYFKEASFGRAVVRKKDRGEGYGHLIVDKALEHLKKNKKDTHTERSLILLVGKRKRLLKYLQKKDIERYRKIIAELGLRK